MQIKLGRDSGVEIVVERLTDASGTLIRVEALGPVALARRVHAPGSLSRCRLQPEEVLLESANDATSDALIALVVLMRQAERAIIEAAKAAGMDDAEVKTRLAQSEIDLFECVPEMPEVTEVGP